MLIELATFTQLAMSCAPSVAPETLAAIARTESRLEAYAIHDNDTGQTFKPASLVGAATLASSLVNAGHNVDLGLMQVNSANLQRLGLTVVKALDPCASVAAGARVLQDCYQGGATDDAQQRALRDAISRYNTGNARRGYENGYVGRVEASAVQVVPAIKVGPLSAQPLAAPTDPAPVPPTAPTPPPVVLDMLHGTETAAGEPAGLVNMLAGAEPEAEAPADPKPIETAAK